MAKITSLKIEEEIKEEMRAIFREGMRKDKNIYTDDIYNDIFEDVLLNGEIEIVIKND